ncbi:Uncharacterized protein OS=Myxococcus fulvus (strain ATCC BAA-855 / HW-1) GN=LILAB_23985 PE=4 SV=1 [Gemmataceae bacterium]|nr:Uncharacterized protein OS=Myxococcus fulvus (strain ATCC BAA-855 / HW-1) GN=LILAB_23985 PE=4 SV=1 [Gemmataceae bacterium]VTT99809.1 Uncharacterized protein OS=Myxococcus fulvus (strain ATCC BAA-855 / HW-1) GN=LILAB_23985 PE=4 SV=1 [Gemmataceae bacterium]
MVAEYRRQLSAALAWCQPRFDPDRAADSLRSPELGPPRNIVHEVTDMASVAAEVAAVLARRAERLGGLPAPAVALPAGDRILAFLPRDSLFHGSSPPECDGFIDADEIPPWGSWIGLVGEMLLSWVPAAMVAGVDSAIRCNPEESIRWASEQPVPLVQELRGLGLLR